ncbi:hypothetical protein M408DRAFT_29360 [Serendipita vermifera MAFF 305830]|uniref:Condensin complex subunit 1 C-terminal domain-containing protein n=1 Tax=Serendipita vermifera MAFF 305830 TaxID=933852 RepID=A0A0C3AAL1_SERVB|nr:hypothetical protein M408DRAFT_29360 [Serendipita vermifera MAFF 305830]
MLKDENDGVRSSAVAVLEQLAKFAKFTNPIGSAVFHLVEMLKDEKYFVRSGALDGLIALAEHAEHRNLGARRNDAMEIDWNPTIF